jgi:hypothetical protein
VQEREAWNWDENPSGGVSSSDLRPGMECSRSVGSVQTGRGSQQ